MIKIKVYLLTIFLVLNINLFSQDDINTDKIGIITKFNKNSIMLRWATSTKELWREGNKYGYNIYRMNLNDTIKIKITKNPIKPYTLKEFETIFKTDSSIMAPAQLIHGKNTQIKLSNFPDKAAVDESNKERNLFSMALFIADQSIKNAKYMGLFYEDFNIDTGEKYIYYITLSDSSKMKHEPGYAFINTSLNEPLPKPRYVKGEFLNKVALISWNAYLTQDVYNSFYVEKSEFPCNNFKRIDKNNLPVMEKDKKTQNSRIYFSDSLHTNEKKYCYRVFGVDAFGESSPPSDTIIGNGVQIIENEFPTIDTIIPSINNKVYIKWSIQNNVKKLIKKYIIENADKIDGFYGPVHKDSLANNIFEYFDSPKYPSNYYRVKAITTTNKPLLSLPILYQIVDSIPPSPPKNLKGYADTSFIVHLEWDINTEPDFIGYHIYEGYDSNHINRTNQIILKTNSYTDTIPKNTLNKFKYYALKAIDNRYNPSNLTSILAVNIPDIIPPFLPILNSQENKKDGLNFEIEIIPEKDVQTLIIKRTEENKPDTTTYKVPLLQKNKIKFVDSAVENGKIYNYQIYTIDLSGNISDYINTTAKRLDLSIPETPQNIKLFFNKNTKSINITWDYNDKKIYSILICRKTMGDNYRILNLVQDPSLKFYQDFTIDNDKSYTYKLKSYYEDGRYSEFSKDIEISTKP